MPYCQSALIFVSAQQHIISDNLPVRKSYFDSNIIQNENTRILRHFSVRIILKRTSTEAHVYMRRHQGAKVEYFDVSNVIYHIFSQGAVSYTLNGQKINVLLKSKIIVSCRVDDHAFFCPFLTIFREFPMFDLIHVISFFFFLFTFFQNAVQRVCSHEYF